MPAIADVFSLTMDELMGIPETKKLLFLRYYKRKVFEIFEPKQKSQYYAILYNGAYDAFRNNASFTALTQRVKALIVT